MKLKYSNGREANDGDPVVFLDGKGKVRAGVAFATDIGDGVIPNTEIGVQVPGEIYPFAVDPVRKLDPSIKGDPACYGLSWMMHAEDLYNHLPAMDDSDRYLPAAK